MILNTTATALDWESIYTKLTSTWTVDTLFLTKIPFNTIAFILNLICVKVFFRINEKIILYKYLKIYSINTAIMSFYGIFVFLSYSPRYISLTYFARFNSCILLNYLITSLYFIGNVMDIFIKVLS